MSREGPAQVVPSAHPCSSFLLLWCARQERSELYSLICREGAPAAHGVRIGGVRGSLSAFCVRNDAQHIFATQIDSKRCRQPAQKYAYVSMLRRSARLPDSSHETGSSRERPPQATVSVGSPYPSAVAAGSSISRAACVQGAGDCDVAAQARSRLRLDSRSDGGGRPQRNAPRQPAPLGLAQIGAKWRTGCFSGASRGAAQSAVHSSQAFPRHNTSQRATAPVTCSQNDGNHRRDISPCWQRVRSAEEAAGRGQSCRAQSTLAAPFGTLRESRGRRCRAGRERAWRPDAREHQQTRRPRRSWSLSFRDAQASPRKRGARACHCCTCAPPPPSCPTPCCVHEP